MRWIVTFLAVCFLVTVCTATVIDVPGEQPTIQAGIKAADEGDTVLVAEDHYYERIDFLGKAIHVASEYILDGDTLHIANTIIDADTLVLGPSDTGSVVTLINYEDSTSVLQGFTLQNGRYGIYTHEGRPTVRNCVIENCGFSGGEGVFVNQFGPLRLLQCRVVDAGALVYGYIILDSCSVDHDVHCFDVGIADISNSTLGSVSHYHGGIEVINSVVGSASAYDGGYLKLRECTINGNISSGMDAYVTIDSCTMQGLNTGSMYVQRS